MKIPTQGSAHMATNQQEIEIAALEAAIAEASTDLPERSRRLREAVGVVVAELGGVARDAQWLSRRCADAEAAVAAARADVHAKFRAGVDYMMEHGPEGDDPLSVAFIKDMAAHSREHQAAQMAASEAVRAKEYTEAKAETEAERLIGSACASMDRLHAAYVEGVDAVLGLRRKLEGLRAGGKGASE